MHFFPLAKISYGNRSVGAKKKKTDKLISECQVSALCACFLFGGHFMNGTPISAHKQILQHLVNPYKLLIFKYSKNYIYIPE